MARKYDDDEREAASIIAWTDRRLNHVVSSGTAALYLRKFERMWMESFGTLDNVPILFKQRAMERYNELKAKEAAEDASN